MEGGPDGADGEALGQPDLVEGAERGEVVFEAESEFDGGDLFGVAMGEVGDVAFADVGAVAIGLAEVDGLVGFAVGGGPGGAGYVHVHIIRYINQKHKGYCEILHVYIFESKITPNRHTLNGLSQNIRGEHPLQQRSREPF